MTARRPLLDLVVCAYLALMFADGMPEWIPGVRTAQRWATPVLDLTGLEQTSWKLFAPDPDHMNAYLEVIVTYDDGATSRWTTPAYADRPLWRKTVDARWHKATDVYRRDDWSGTWPSVLRYGASQAVPPSPGATPVHAELVRHWWMVPPPRSVPEMRARFGVLPPRRDQFPGHHVMLSRALGPGVTLLPPVGRRVSKEEAKAARAKRLAEQGGAEAEAPSATDEADEAPMPAPGGGGEETP